MRLTSEQVHSFRRNGYLIVENVLDEDDLQAVRQEYADRMDVLYRGWFTDGLVTKPPNGLGFWEKLDQCYSGAFDWFQPLDISLPHENIVLDTPMHCGPATFALLRHDNILDIVEEFIGPEITSNPIQHVRIKPPQHVLPKTETRAHITSTDWHQDRGVTLAEADETEMITVWVAITDATVENGCLQVSPGIHSDMLPHCTFTQVGIPDAFLPQGEAIPTPVKAGGIVMFHPLTPHASLPNRSDGYRWSFDLRYNVTGQPTGRSQFPDFVARSRSNPDSELRDWRAWKQSWLDTRSHLASVEHIPQHRWSSDTPYCA